MDKGASKLESGGSQSLGIWLRGAIARFRGLEPTRRNQILVIAGIVLACLAGLLWYLSRTDWRTLYAGLDPDDARQMAQSLTAAGIPFDVSPDGSSLRVPAPNLDKARVAVTAKGGPKSGRMGFEIFDKPNWMGSEFDEQVNYQRAVEGELEHTIGTLDAVQSARVHLVLFHDSLFTGEQRDAKASVVLRLRHHTLSDPDAEGIVNLVANAVEDLRPENVVLLDADGHGLLGRRGADAAMTAHEQQQAAKVIDTLEPVTGIGNVRASVTVECDPTSADEVDESYDPAQSVTLSMQRTEQTSGQPSTAGIPGTASNAPNTKPPLYPAQNASMQSLRQESGTYAVSKKVRHTVQATGRVRRVTAAVLIIFRRVTRGQQVDWQLRSADEMRQLKELAQSAIGFDATRGDQVTVEELPFDGDPSPSVPPLRERLMDALHQSRELLRYGSIVVVFLSFFLIVMRPALRSLTAGARFGTNVSQIAGAESLPVEPERRALTPEHLAAEHRKHQAQNTFDQVAEHVKREPAQSTRLLESWIRSE